MADYPGAIDYPAHSTNTLGPPCNPKGWVLHTPEEPADGYPGTPHWFATFHANPDQRGSTHYFVSYLGFVFQCVSESTAAIANGVLGKPYPAWANDKVSLNRQTLNVEIEGYAATIRNTISPAQKTALINLLAYGCDKYGFPRDRAHIIGHYQVATNRTDPGTLDIDALVAALQEDEMTPTEKQQLDNATNDIDTVSQQVGNATALAVKTAQDFEEFKKAEAAVNAGIYGAVVEVVKALPGGDSNLATQVAELERRVGDAAKVLSGE